jgi:hypothetical protein
MRNARNTRRQSVTVGLTVALLTMLIALVVAGCGGRQLQLRLKLWLQQFGRRQARCRRLLHP